MTTTAEDLLQVNQVVKDRFKVVSFAKCCPFCLCAVYYSYPFSWTTCWIGQNLSKCTHIYFVSILAF